MSRQAVRRLVARATESSAASRTNPDRIADALHRVHELVAQNLRESIGGDGWDALLTRAIARTEPLHPVISRLRDPAESGLSRARLSDAARADGAATEAAVEALLTTLIDILARLIGEDMAIRIIDPGGDGDARLAAPNGAHT